jgi:hypothetical protein
MRCEKQRYELEYQVCRFFRFFSPDPEWLPYYHIYEVIILLILNHFNLMIVVFE